MAEVEKIFPFLGTLPSQVLRDEISIKLDQLFDNLKKLTLEKKDPWKAAKTTSADLFSSLRPTLREQIGKHLFFCSGSVKQHLQ